MKTIVLVTGGFDPLHSGHIEYFKYAKSLGDELWVGLNSDEWLTRKKGRPFMPFAERLAVVQNLFMVDTVLDFDDTDGSACGAIFKTKSIAGIDTKIVFANGGDRTNANIPELVMYGDDPQIEFAFGVGGNDKKNSSSWILEEWKNPKTVRNWGWYRVLDDKPGYKVKELVIESGKSLSMQRHFKRSEHWYVLKGQCKVLTEWQGHPNEITLSERTSGYVIEKETWHQGINKTDKPCHILEVQYGEQCVEEDIERRDQ